MTITGARVALTVVRAIYLNGSLEAERNGETVIYGPVADQSALHGLLSRVRDLGLPLVSVNSIEPNQDSDADERR